MNKYEIEKKILKAKSKDEILYITKNCTKEELESIIILLRSRIDMLCSEAILKTELQ